MEVHTALLSNSFDHHASLREKSAMSRSDQLVIAFGFQVLHGDCRIEIV